MSELVADCPRCGSSRITFDLMADTLVSKWNSWKSCYEAFCVCRNCGCSTVFLLSENGMDESEIIRESGLTKLSCSVNKLVKVEHYISLKDATAKPAPEHLPHEIRSIFSEGATCLAVGCFNAAGTMFRLCVDLATKSLLPVGDVDGLNSNARHSLGHRLPWLFKTGRLPEALQELSSCIKEDGNDGAHAGTLQKVDAEDLLDFTFALLERMYTEPERLRLAMERRTSRRAT